MKKKKEKAIVKEARKAAKKELTVQIVSALQLVTVNFVKESKKAEKLITKQAKQLSNKLAKEIEFKKVEVKIEETPS